MALLRITRFEVDDATTEDTFRSARARLIDHLREHHGGIEETVLGRREDGSWVDVWRWESPERLRAVMAAIPTLPDDVRAGFALLRNATTEEVAIAEQR